MAIVYIGNIEPSAEIEREAYAHLGLSKIPELRGTELKVSVSKADRGLYYARVEGPGKGFAGELYFPINPHESYARILREGLSMTGSVPLLYMMWYTNVRNEKTGEEAGDAGALPITVGKLWSALSECTPMHISRLLLNIRERLEIATNPKNKIRRSLEQFDARREFVHLEKANRRLLEEAVINAENFEFYLTGEKPSKS